MWRQGARSAVRISLRHNRGQSGTRFAARKNAASSGQKMLNFPGCRRRFYASRTSVGETHNRLSPKILVSAIAGMVGATAFLTNSTTRDGAGPTVFAEEAGPSSSTPSPSNEENNSNKAEKSAANQVERPNTVVSIYLNNETKEMLKARYPGMFSNERYDHLTVHFDPSQSELKSVYKLLGNEYSIQALALVSNESSQVLYCQIIQKNDGGRALHSSNKYPHVTLTFSDSTDAKASNLLLQRADARGLLEVAAASKKFSWNGVLPVWKDEKGKLYAATKVRVESVKGESSPLLVGTLCSNRHWKKADMESTNGEMDTYYCDKPTCGFCEFMKGGPCREVFIQWEICVDKCNDVSSDFVDECTTQTIQLKDCIDSNQEYYGVLNQPPPEEENKDSPADESSERAATQ